MARQDHSPLTNEQLATFLEELSEGKSIQGAAAAAGRKKQTFYRYADTHPDYRRAWDHAYEEGTDALEQEAQRRAVDGVTDFRLDREGSEHPFIRYSDTLLIFLLKARRPEKFRDNVKHEHSGPNGEPIPVEHRGVKLSDIVRVAREAGVELGD